MVRSYVSHNLTGKEVTMKTTIRLVVNTLIVIATVALVSTGFMQTDPHPEEMRQLRLEARAMQSFNPAEVADVKALAEAKASPQALQFAFDDSSFDYYDKEEGYLRLDYDAGILTLKLQDAADGMVHSFPEIGRLNPEDHNRIYSEHQHVVALSEKRDLLADEQARLRERINLTQEDGSLELIHEEAYLASVENYYLSSLERFGFTAQPTFKHSNAHSYTLKNGTHEASILFTRKGTDIRVRLQA